MVVDAHGERRLVINNRVLSYTGIFHISELFSRINSALVEKGYTLREKRNEEVVTENGRNIFLELRPYKEMSDYILLLIKIRITLRNVTEQVQTLDGQTYRFDKGDVEIAFDAWSYTDFGDRWGGKALPYAISGIINKFFIAIPSLDNHMGTVSGDTGYVYGQVKSLLSSYRRRDSSYVPEEEIRKKIQEEVEKAEEKISEGEDPSSSVDDEEVVVSETGV